MQLVILAVGQDEMILSTRSSILRSAGHIVKSSPSVSEAMALVRGEDFDLVLLCHSIPEHYRDWFVHAVRASGSRIPIYTVTPGSAAFSPGLADGTLPHTPPDLLKAIQALLIGPGTIGSTRQP